MIHVGSCGFGSSRAAYYARLPAVEVQHTFYRPPRPATLAGWRAEAPEGFTFALKPASSSRTRLPAPRIAG